jgi:hypothetical protein
MEQSTNKTSNTHLQMKELQHSTEEHRQEETMARQLTPLLNQNLLINTQSTIIWL